MFISPVSSLQMLCFYSSVVYSDFSFYFLLFIFLLFFPFITCFLCSFACCLVVCLCCVFPPVLLYQTETPCLLVPPSNLPTKPGADNLSLVPTGTALHTVYLWRLRSLLLFGVVSRLCTPLNLCFNKYLFLSFCFWVPSCWPWQYNDGNTILGWTILLITVGGMFSSVPLRPACI